MNNTKAPSPLPSADYEAIEDALLQSSRGRWFLSEYGQRNRTADTKMLLDAITKLEKTVTKPGKPAESAHIRNDLIEMAEAISQTRSEIASMRTQDEEDCQFTSATEELDAIVEATENATSDILEAAEDVQELAWVLREKGTEDEACDRLDARATDIYTACSFQDITGQRTGKVVKTLRFLENRVLAMIEIWGLEDVAVHDHGNDDERPDAHLLNGPARRGEEVNQNDIDQLLIDDGQNTPVFEGEVTPPSQIAEAAPAAEEPPQDVAMAAEPVAQTIEQPAEQPVEDSFDAPPLEAQAPATAVSQDAEEPEIDSAENGVAQVVELEGEVEAVAFSAPADLDIDELDETKTQVLFT